MSTRSQIAIYEKETDEITPSGLFLYRHCDGDPQSVLADIKPFLVNFNKVRGINDTCYCLARLTQHLTNLHNKHQNELFDRVGQTGSAFEKEILFLGYGIMSEIACDIEYFYHVSPTAIKVYTTPTDNPNDWKLLKRVALPKNARMVAA